MRAQISLVGPLKVVASGAELSLPTRKTEALLAVLALRPGVAVGREWLSALLWPDTREAQARTSLRQAVGHLRRALGNPVIVSAGEKLHLDPTHAAVDAAELGQQLARPPSERLAALPLWRGELLAGFSVIEAPFDAWLSDERARLAERVATRLEECLAALSAAGDVERAIAVGSHVVELEPTREATHRALMTLYAASGDRAAAMRQYDRCRELLRRHLELSPSKETDALRRALAETETGSDAPTTRREPPPESAAQGQPRVPLAVLPFERGTDDEPTRLLACGLTEDVTTELSRFRQLGLIARGTVAEVAAVSSRAEWVGKETGARLVLAGSVRSAADKFRVTAALTDATTGLELWSERWDASHEDPFRLLDSLTKSVVAALALRIDETRLGKIRDRPRERLEAYDCWLKGLDCLRRGSPDADEEARSLFEQALRISPSFARAYAGISLTHFNDWSCQAWDRWEQREKLSFENARRAVELDDGDHVTHTILSRIHLYRREFEIGQRHAEHAIRLNSNDADMLMHAAIVFAQLGDAERANQLTDDALRLNPKHPDWYYAVAAFTRLSARNLEECLDFGLRAPDAFVDTRAILSAASAHAGKPVRAREHAQHFLEQFRAKIVRNRAPESGEAVRWLLHVNPLQRTSESQYLLQGLQLAGLELP